MNLDQEELETADRRAETAKASLRRRLHELERRVTNAREKLDVGSRIAQHPRLAVGIALGAGALLGLLGRRRAPADTMAMVPSERSKGSAFMAVLGALAVQGLRELVMSQGAEIAKKWWDERQAADAKSADTDARASY